jgi:hypothetical protein
MLIESIFGLEFDALNNRIQWTIGIDGEHGVRNLHFNGKVVSLVTEKSDPATHRRKVTVDTTGEINFILSKTGQFLENQRTLPAGRHELWV